MKVGIFADEAAVGKAAAQHLIDVMNAADPKVLGVATGSSPQPMYAELRKAHAEGTFTLADAKAFALDEYVGIAPDHPERYRNFLVNELVGEERTGLADESLHVPDGQAEDLDAAAAEYDRDIAAAGPVALQILGIGADGHIGFNEPGVSLVCRTHWDHLAEQTIKDNARFFDGDLSKVPTKCVTQGLGTIMEAKEVLLIATGANKADAVRELVEGAISARWPATILQMHPEVTVFLDEAAASKLELTGLYKERWNA